MVGGLAIVVLLCVFFIAPWTASADLVTYNFNIGTQRVTRLCKKQEIVTVNGQFPGPTIYVHEGDELVVHVQNDASYNITLHWHGIRQWRSCWADGPAYVTQCPIAPSTSFTYKFPIREQEGTLWWHAHISWLRATVYGALVIYPRIGKPYPFPKPTAEVPILLGEWWNANVEDVINQAIRTGGVPNESDAFTINSHPGDLYPCSANETFRILVECGETYLVRIINAALNHALFFKIAKHTMTVVAVDALYTKPYKTRVVLIHPGQTTDVLLKARKSSGLYYMASRVYSSTAPGISFNNSTATAILEYKGSYPSHNSMPAIPRLPAFNDTPTAYKFSTKLRSLRPNVPQFFDEEMLITSGLGLERCPNNSCAGPNGSTLVGSMNNISFVLPTIALLQANYFGMNGVFSRDYPDNPPLKFDYTGQNLPPSLLQPEKGTKVRVLKFNSTVQIVFQGTSLVSNESHPIHIHGYDFYVVGQGFGDYNPATDPAKFNLVNPQMRNTIGFPTGGWAAIRFTVDNPGIWFVHCHIDAHSVFGLAMALLVENGPLISEELPPPPLDLPRC